MKGQCLTFLGGDDRHDAAVHLRAVPEANRRSVLFRTSSLRRRLAGAHMDQKATADGGAGDDPHRG